MPIPKKDMPDAPKSAKIRVYETLRDWIIDGTLQPGEKILDSELSAYFSVSRTPVREAIQLLADQKLLEVFPGRATQVSDIDCVDISETYHMLAELNSMAVEFAYPHITEEHLENLKKINERFLLASEKHDFTKSRAHDKEFHDTFVKLAGNDFLTNFIETLTCHIARLENVYFDQILDAKDSVNEHAQIIEALEGKDLEKAKEFMKQNWIHTAEIFEATDILKNTKGTA